MAASNFTLLTELALPCLLSLPASQQGERGKDRQRPLLFFLHGYMEGPPTEIRAGLTAHGPLSRKSSPLATEEFIVVAPQLPARGDLWRRYAHAVCTMVPYVRDSFGGDPRRTYLTGFSYGGNGVFDIALHDPALWTALWPVDPTRVPESDPGLPVWLSSGEAARPSRQGFIKRLRLVPPGGDGERIFVDEGLDHVGTATSAYRNESIYRWLLSQAGG